MDWAAGVRDAWRLAKPYFASEDRRAAWGLLSAIIALNLVGVYLNVVYTFWYKVAYDALQSKTASAFWASMFTYRIVHGFPYIVPGFVENAALTIAAGVYAFYLNQMLQIRWRRWLTEHFIDDWLDRRAYYQISLQAQAGTPLDNPDQRIAEDLTTFVGSNLTLGISLLSNVVTLLSFAGVLWAIAPPLVIGHVAIPGYLMWAAVVYSIAGTYLTQRIGRRLIPLNVQQQQVNADFRFNLVRVRENTEQIALSRGERDESDGLRDRFAAIYANWWHIMKRTKGLNFFTIGFTQVAIIFPLVVAAPGYFSGIFTLGVLLQIGTIFGNVQGALSWFVTSYPDLVDWRATVARLAGFRRAVDEAHAHADAGAPVAATGDALEVEGLAVALPDGRPLIEADRLTLQRGEPIAVTGPSGIGKSTLFRVFAGIWPFARGRVVQPSGSLMFLPQRAYMPLGTLKRAVVYPLLEDEVADNDVRAALESVELDALTDRLHDVDNWTLRLSGGEQQRLALARALLSAPDWLFLDEAMSALDEPAVASLFALLRRRLPHCQIVSIAHHDALVALHPRQLSVVGAVPRDGTRQPNTMMTAATICTAKMTPTVAGQPPYAQAGAGTTAPSPPSP
jgi:vitamin B12/bleomycin/antimicrobial peptide transport system ATP-binding/permease protein